MNMAKLGRWMALAAVAGWIAAGPAQAALEVLLWLRPRHITLRRRLIEWMRIDIIGRPLPGIPIRDIIMPSNRSEKFLIGMRFCQLNQRIIRL